MALNVSAIMAAVRGAERAALEDVLPYTVADAKHRAPIRKVFRERPGFRRRFRPLSTQERAAAIRLANAYYNAREPGGFRHRRAVANYRNYAQAVIPRRGSANSLANSRRLRILGHHQGGSFRSAYPGLTRTRRGFDTSNTSLHPLLTARGRYEIRSGRAIHREVTASGATRIQVGGALKASIESEGVVETATGMSARVTAAIRYAKYQEFGTVHNPAQPFMLPALHDSRARFRAALKDQLRRALGG